MGTQTTHHEPGRRVRPLAFRSGCTRASFDGRIVVFRRVCRVPGRPARESRYTLTDFDRAWFRSSDHDGGWQLRVLRLARSDFWISGQSSVVVPRRRHRRGWAMAMTINEARAERMRFVLRRTVGLGPWPEETWAGVDAVLRGCGVLGPVRPGRPEADRLRVYGLDLRERFGRILAALRHERPPTIAPWWAADIGVGPPFPAVGGRATVAWVALSAGEPVVANAWNIVIDHLADGRDVTADAAWDRHAAELLRYGHHLARSTPRDRLPQLR